ncbi:alkaline phosphatase family protein [Candidatus Bathyarchaeota archaeon]|nr:alkaline phosphatase family protein [Candidatus Bathyarchaeota archaeon]
MRVLILAYDGLDHDLVETLNLGNIMQTEHGKVDVPIVGGIDDPSTPIVWTSFITGEPPEVHGVDMPQVWNNELDGLRSYVRRHRRLYGLLKRFRVGYRVRDTLGAEASFPSRKNIKVDTFFEAVKPSIALGVPVYNKNLHEIYPVGDVLKARQDPEYTAVFEERVRRIFREEVETLFDALNADWRLLMIHFHITDLFGHAFWGTEKLNTLYEEMDLLTKRVKTKLHGDDLVLIISDHGMGKLGHTKKGFYSFNKPIGLKDPDIKDFYGIVTGLLADD